MILEVAILNVKIEHEENFEKDFVKAGQFISSVEGCVKNSSRMCLEEIIECLLLVDFVNVEDHILDFRVSV